MAKKKAKRVRIQTARRGGAFRKSTSLFAHDTVNNILADIKSQPRQAPGPGEEEHKWTWNQLTDFRDLATGKPVMHVIKDMELRVNPNDGSWGLTYQVRNFVTRHRWVFKLDAADANGKVLYTLIVPRLDRSSGILEIRRGGRSDFLEVTDPADIDHWIRRGVGEYRE